MRHNIFTILRHFRKKIGHTRFRGILCGVVCVLILCTSGCVRRRITIDSNPRGAVVYIDEHQLGRTPISTDFTYYGTRNIRLELDNYQTLHVRQEVRPPWYQYPVLDFFSETFSPNEIKDQHTWTYNLVPQTLAARDQLLSRARQLQMDGVRTVDARGNPGAAVLREHYLETHPPRPSSSAIPGETPETSVRPAGVSPIFPPDTPSSPGREPYFPSLDAAFPETVPSRAAPENSGFPRGSETWDGPPRYPMQ